MAQKSIEFILFRQFASYIPSAIFMVDASNNLVFCNEAAERILGFRFSETGEMSKNEWITILSPQDESGTLLDEGKLPLFITHKTHRIATASFYIRNIHNEIKHIEMISFPIINEITGYLGSGIFIQEVRV